MIHEPPSLQLAADGPIVNEEGGSPIVFIDLLVEDLETQVEFYRSVLGFEVVGQPSETRIELGRAGNKLLGLQAGASRMSSPVQAGLFHAAWRLGSRQDLGHWLAHSLKIGVALDGASDHGVSEAIYLNDPEGNGIEVYWDRPKASWPYTNGKLSMVTEPLDLRALLSGSSAEQWRGFPHDANLGHLHLQSPDLPGASQFFQDLGFALTQVYPGAHFLSLDGYHHHLAVNHWRARTARDPRTAGLLAYGLRLAGPSRHLSDPLGATAFCLNG